MLVKIGTTDLTKYIEDGSYDVDAVAQYEEWQDANYVKHRAYVRSAVSGSFNVICSSKTITISALKTLMANNTTNNKLYAILWVENEGQLKSINCFCATKAVHNPTVDIVTVIVEEC